MRGLPCPRPRSRRRRRRVRSAASYGSERPACPPWSIPGPPSTGSALSFRVRSSTLSSTGGRGAPTSSRRWPRAGLPRRMGLCGRSRCGTASGFTTGARSPRSTWLSASSASCARNPTSPAARGRPCCAGPPASSRKSARRTRARSSSFWRSPTRPCSRCWPTPPSPSPSTRQGPTEPAASWAPGPTASSTRRSAAWRSRPRPDTGGARRKPNGSCSLT